tara:strand:- start:3052 stop:3495 length:444 start_codon:yes stop_codon:yes gene_type:complete
MPEQKTYYDEFLEKLTPEQEMAIAPFLTARDMMMVCLEAFKPPETVNQTILNYQETARTVTRDIFRAMELPGVVDRGALEGMMTAFQPIQQLPTIERMSAIPELYARIYARGTLGENLITTILQTDQAVLEAIIAPVLSYRQHQRRV